MIHFIWSYTQLQLLTVVNNISLYSPVLRPFIQESILQENLEKTLLVRLEGYLFFGTANNILEALESRLLPPQRQPKTSQALSDSELAVEDNETTPDSEMDSNYDKIMNRFLLKPWHSKTTSLRQRIFLFFNPHFQEHSNRKSPLKYLLIDFTKVAGLDSTAYSVFKTLAGICANKHIFLVLAGIPKNFQAMFNFYYSGLRHVKLFPLLGDAVEWTENHLIAKAEKQTVNTIERSSSNLSNLDFLEDQVRKKPFTFRQAIEPHLADNLDLNVSCQKLKSYFETKKLSRGQVLFDRGMASSSLYFIKLGKLSGYLEPRKEGSSRFRLFSLSRGKQHILIGSNPILIFFFF